MTEEEIEEYHGGSTKSIKVFHTRTYIDYSDIETPIKTLIKGNIEVTLALNLKTDARYTMNTHEFHDMPSRLQLFSEETTTQYLNLEHDEFSQTKIGVEKGKDDYYFQGKLVWSETK